MRIGFITNLYPPHGRGGAERVVEEEVTALKRAGHDVFVITAAPLPEDGDPRPRLSVEGGVRVYRYYPVNLFFYGEIGEHGVFSRLIFHLWDLRNGASARAVRRLLEEEKPEVVHTHNLKGVGFAIPGMLRSLGLRHVHTLHDVQLAVPSGLILKGQEGAWSVASLPVRAYASVTRRLMGSPEVVISPSKFLLRFHDERGFFPRSEKVWLPNPAPRTVLAPHEPSKETRFLFLGQVERHKGILLLIQTVRRLFKDRPKARLDVVGTGAALEAAIRVSGKDLRIAFHGRKRPADFARLFAGVDYTVLPSLCYENAPTVVLESFAHGVPVIAADIGGAAELVREGENGLTFEAGDVDALLSVLKRACDEKGEWPLRSKAARRAAELLTAPHHAARLMELYRGKDAALPHRGPVVPVRYRPQSLIGQG
jgi:glycosyltransferase involved in cell wall biosynthesis